MIVIEGCAIATVDAERREIADGHIVVDGDRIAAVGEGPAPARSRGRAADRRARLPGHAGPRELPPPPVPVGDARAGDGRDALRVARRALSRLGAHRRRDRRGGRARRARVARGVGLHDLDGPPLRLPARRRGPPRRRDRGRRAHRPALPPVPRRDGPRREPGRAAAGLARRGPRRDPRCVRGGDRPLPRPVARREGAHRARSHLAVLRHAGSCSSRPPTLARRKGVRLHTHLAETIEEEEFCLEQLRRAAAGVPRRHRLARRRRVARALRAPRRGGGGADGGDRHRRRALPDLQRPPRRRYRERARAPGRGRAGRPRGRRRGVQRGAGAHPRGARRAHGRARRPRPPRALGAPGARARHPATAPAASGGRTSSAT